MNTDRLTSVFGFVATVSGALSSSGVYSKADGLHRGDGFMGMVY